MDIVKSNEVLPKGWVDCLFGDIARIRNGYAFKSSWFNKELNRSSGVPVVRQSQLKGNVVDLSDAVLIDRKYLNEYDGYKLKKGDVLVGMSGSIGKVCVYKDEEPSLQNQRTGKLDFCSSEFFDRDLLRYYLSRIERELFEFAKGMGVQNISGKDIERLSLPFPPINEQRRIVAKIEELFSELDAGVENLKTAWAQLGVYRQALLKKAFEGKLTEKWRAANPDKLESVGALLTRIRKEREARYQQQLDDWKSAVSNWEAEGKTSKKPTKPRKLKPVEPLNTKELAELHELPEGWMWLRLESVYVESVLGKMLDKKKNKGKYRNYLRNINVRWDFFDLANLLQIRIEDSEVDRYRVKDGDLIVCEGGEPGRCAVWESCYTKDIFLQKALHRVRFTKSVSPHYIQKFIKYSAKKEQIVRFFTGTTIKHLTGQGLAVITVPLCSLPEQREIVRILEEQFTAIEQNEREIDTALQRAEALRQSILKKAFSGKLVSQDPSDEPASVLLERIRNEREAKPKAKPKRKNRRRQVFG